jgi:transposase
MGEVSTIGLDLAKHVFQAHGADASGAVLFRKKLWRQQVLTFFAAQPPCTVAMEGTVNLSKLEHFECIALASNPLKVRNPRRPETGTKHAKSVKLTMARRQHAGAEG